MGLREWIGVRGARDKPTNSYAGSALSFLFGRSTSGKPVNERTAMQTTAVYACVRILSEAVASLPLNLYRYTDNGKERVYDHPLYHVLHDEPNEEMTSFVFRETLMSHLLIWGNAYAQIIRDGRGQVLALYPLLPDKMQVDRAENGELYYIYSRSSEENPNFKDTGDIILRKEEVLHIPGLGFDGLIGYSPIAMAKNAVGMTIACEEYGASFFANGATPGGVLEHPGVLKDPAKVRDSWHSVYGGSKNAGTYFGGTWVAWGSGRVPVGINTSDTNFSTVEKTGGASTVTLTTAQMPSHTHTFTGSSATTNSKGAHTHNVGRDSDGAAGSGAVFTVHSAGVSGADNTSPTSSAGAHTHTVTAKGTNASTGGGGSHTNLQPYIVCYMWKRTA